MERTVAVATERRWLYVALLIPGSVSLLMGQPVRAVLWLGTTLLLWSVLFANAYLDGSAFTILLWAGALLIVHLLHWRNAVRAFLSGEQPLNQWLDQLPNLALSALTLGILMMGIALGMMVSLATASAYDMWLTFSRVGFGANFLPFIDLTIVALIGGSLGVGGFFTARWGWNQEHEYLQMLRERAILETAQAQGGVVSVSEVALATGLSLAESKELLEELCAKRLIERVPQAEGPMLYRVFPSNT